MSLDTLKQLQSITSPFAFTSEHVQGPGGNTSYKQNGEILIKGSGFTFRDVTQDNGVVKLENQRITNSLHAKQALAGHTESQTPEVLDSIPLGIKPSMEYEFHSLLSRYVLHTHLVYANVVTCAAECEKLLTETFTPEEYLLIPYVTPGYPIAEALLSQTANHWPPIIFLKNHGIIVHADTAEEVIERYTYAENKLKQQLKLNPMPELPIQERTETNCIIDVKTITGGQADTNTMEEELTGKVLIPDQSIFFRNKISSVNSEAEIFIDISAQQVVITGSEKFIAAAVSMLQAVYYIKSNIARLGLTADHIGQEYLDILHGLSTEKYRLSLLKK